MARSTTQLSGLSSPDFRRKTFATSIDSLVALAQLAHRGGDSRAFGAPAISTDTTVIGAGYVLRLLLCQNLRYLFLQRRDAFGEHRLIRAAKVIQIFEAAIPVVPVLGTAAVGERLPFASLAQRMSDGLLAREIETLLPARDFGPRIQVDVAQLPALLYEEVAG